MQVRLRSRAAGHVVPAAAWPIVSYIPLPVEILDEIFGHFAPDSDGAKADTRTLQSLCRTCSAFLGPAQRFLYRRIVLQISERSFWLCRTLVGKPYLAHHTRQASLSLDRHGSNFVLAPATFRMVFRAMRLMTHLKRLELAALRDVKSDFVFSNIISCGFQLEVLILSPSFLRPYSLLEQQPCVQELYLKTGVDGLPGFDPPVSFLPSLQKLTTDNTEVAVALMQSRPQSRPLLSLSLPLYKHPDSLRSMAPASHKLQCLTLTFVTFYYGIPTGILDIIASVFSNITDLVLNTDDALQDVVNHIASNLSMAAFRKLRRLQTLDISVPKWSMWQREVRYVPRLLTRLGLSCPTLRVLRFHDTPEDSITYTRFAPGGGAESWRKKRATGGCGHSNTHSRFPWTDSYKRGFRLPCRMGVQRKCTLNDGAVHADCLRAPKARIGWLLHRPLHQRFGLVLDVFLATGSHFDRRRSSHNLAAGPTKSQFQASLLYMIYNNNKVHRGQANTSSIHVRRVRYISVVLRKLSLQLSVLEELDEFGRERIHRLLHRGRVRVGVRDPEAALHALHPGRAHVLLDALLLIGRNAVGGKEPPGGEDDLILREFLEQPQRERRARLAGAHPAREQRAVRRVVVHVYLEPEEHARHGRHDGEERARAVVLLRRARALLVRHEHLGALPRRRPRDGERLAQVLAQVEVVEEEVDDRVAPRGVLRADAAQPAHVAAEAPLLREHLGDDRHAEAGRRLRRALARAHEALGELRAASEEAEA